MRIWLLKDGETLPVQNGSRKMRTWMLADALADRGHDVVWWSSTFSHQRKELVADGDGTFPVRDGVELKLLHAGTYRSNISVNRLRHHRRLARRFAAAAEAKSRPDAIVCAYPIIEFAGEAVRFARRHGIPIVVDVRDLWPEYIVERFPALLRGAASLALRGAFQEKRYILQNADCVVATTEGILKWALETGGRERRPRDRPFYLGYPASTIDAAQPQPGCPEYLQPFRNRTIVSFVGIFGSAYDLATVCRAARTLAAEGDNRIHFVLAGKGLRYDEVFRKVRGLPNVTLPGWLWKPQLDALLRHSDVGLVPFDDGIPDAMPNKVFEFLSAGIPLLTSLSGELRQLIETCNIGAWYPGGDYLSLLTQLRRLASDRLLLDELSQNALEVFQERFTAEKVYGEYAEHIERLLADAAEPVSRKAAA